MIAVAIVLSLLFFAAGWVGAAVAFGQHKAAQKLAGEARHDIETKVALCNRFPLLLKMDRLADHDLEALLNDAPDDVLQWAALGLAAYAAAGDEALGELCDHKAAYLAGEMTEDTVLEHLADAFVDTSSRDRDGKRGFSARERAVHAGLGLNGAGAFATALKHLVEEHREKNAEQAKA